MPGVRDGRHGEAGAWLALAGAVVVMGGQFAVAKRGLAAGLSAYDIVALRFLGAAVVAAAILWRRGLSRLGGVGWGRGAVLAFVAGSPYALMMYAALRFAPSAHGAMLVPGIGLIVTTVAGAAWVGERHGALRYAGVAIVLAGLVILGGGGIAAPGQSTTLGDVLFVVVGVEWGLFTLLVRRWRLDPLAATAALSAVSLLYLPVYVLWLDPRLAEVALSALVLQAVYQGVLQTAFAFAGYAYAVTRVGAGTAAIATAAVPVTGTLIAIPVAGEWPIATTWIGLVAVCAGIAVANVGRGRSDGRRQLAAGAAR
jgi:drug/metabolite transporter (DMT)-like permease